MYIEDTNIFILSAIAIVLIGLLVSRVITNDIKYKHEKGKYKRRHKHYTDLYNKYQDCVQAMQEREELFHHTYYEFVPEFLDRCPVADDRITDIIWYSSEQKLDAAIDHHNNLAALIKKRLTELELPTDTNKLDKATSKLDKDEAKLLRRKWYEATNQIADNLKIPYGGNYAFYFMPFHINVGDFVDGAGDWYHTKTVNVTVDGVQDLLNKIAV